VSDSALNSAFDSMPRVDVSMQQVLFVNLILVAVKLTAVKESDFFLLVQLPLKRRSMLELAAAV
jgi:hypothetical protein